jgi:hypothetical protein
VIDTQVREDWLDALADFPQQLRDLIDGVPVTTLTRAAPGGGWGAVEIFCHLRDWEAIYIERAERMLREREPQIMAVDDTLWPIERDYHAADPHAALREFAARRAQFVKSLGSISAADWQRGGHHSQAGWITITWLVERAAEHDAESLAQLRALPGIG